MTAGTSIWLNGEIRTLDCAVISELVQLLGHGDRESGIAVAVNGEVVARAKWSTHALRGGDVVDVVGAVQGG